MLSETATVTTITLACGGVAIVAATAAAAASVGVPEDAVAAIVCSRSSVDRF